MNDCSWISFDDATPDGNEIVQQYLGKSVMEHMNPHEWAFPTARWNGIKDDMATHWRYIEAPN